jgi:hypothetical protein
MHSAILRARCHLIKALAPVSSALQVQSTRLHSTRSVFILLLYICYMDSDEWIVQKQLRLTSPHSLSQTTASQAAVCWEIQRSIARAPVGEVVSRYIKDALV